MREEMALLDQYVAPGLRLWMLIGLVSSVLLTMIVIVCCFVRLRIPRTKRQIELRAAKRRKRKAERAGTDFADQHEQVGSIRIYYFWLNWGSVRPPV
uniref:Transmembrane inner ear expressed protein n=1 Tax=Meloidogyne javanica TaxID=6303 RepID=A0A915LKL9_MELJA